MDIEQLRQRLHEVATVGVEKYTRKGILTGHAYNLRNRLHYGIDEVLNTSEKPASEALPIRLHLSP